MVARDLPCCFEDKRRQMNPPLMEMVERLASRNTTMHCFAMTVRLLVSHSAKWAKEPAVAEPEPEPATPCRFEVGIPAAFCRHSSGHHPTY